MSNRSVVISTSKLNRKGLRLLSSGGDFEQYKKNPILLFMHNRPWRGTSDEVLPLGIVENIRLEGDEWKGDLNFDMDDPFAARVAQKWDKGIYKMVSPGVTPTEFSDAPEHLLPGQRYATLTKWRADEISVVDIGANDDALSIKNSAGKYITLSDDADLSFLPEINPISTNQILNMKEIAIKLGLAADATEEQILTAIAQRDARIAELQSSESTVKLNAITLAVDTAIKEKRITEKQKDHFVKLGQDTSIETLGATLAAIEPAVKPTQLINRGGDAPAVKSKWEEFSPQEIEQLKADDINAYKLMFENHYGFAPQI